ncbi:MAG TPA: glycosyltransferase family 2 protein [Candidatus Hydrogenedentes bacterium]|nr:glycosyltransferase family 2 protein [Candidatus Hydrogenedentota bacterium]HOS03082.1 glycosyltransferase family 2 protein [Candidatus Hydrogenedentota bacterium]
MLEISVVIPAKDHRPQLAALLDSLREESQRGFLREVIVVDDGSDPPLAPVVEARGARCIRLEQNQGPAHGRNVGAREAVGDVLFFMDADVICPPGAVEKAHAVLAQNPDTAAVSFMNQAFVERDNTFQNYGAAIERFWFESFFGDDEDVAPISGFMTRCGAIRKDAFWALEGFDETYRTNAHEDYDFGKRLGVRFKSVMTREPVFHHDYPASLRRLIRNYWVRITLFVPYYLERRPALDKAQISRKEAFLRLLGLLAPGFFLLALLPAPAKLLWGLAGAGSLAAYGFYTRRFLRAARAWSGTLRFAAAAFVIHYVSSLVICGGGAWALGQCVLGRLRRTARVAPIR